MANNKHLDVGLFHNPERFKSKRSARNQGVPQQNRIVHGKNIQNQYQNVLNERDKIFLSNQHDLSSCSGIYVEIISVKGSKLPLDSLDNTNFKLCSCGFNEGAEVAVIFIPEEKRNVFFKKINEYLDPEKDGKPDKDNVKKPRNQPLIDSIDTIKLANIQSFWTDSENKFPKDKSKEIWWELWLKKDKKTNIIDFGKAAEKLKIRIGNTSLSFFDSHVVLIYSSASNLELIPYVISNILELRMASDTPFVLTNSSPQDQQAWLSDLAKRIIKPKDSSTAVSILDTGINYNHQLLRYVASKKLSTAWNPTWPLYDEYELLKPYNDHASLQAGLATFGDLLPLTQHNEPILVSHVIESGRILPPKGSNQPELYGSITVGTAAKLEIENPNIRRVFSLAVTSAHEGKTGQPSSWSAEIDRFTCGMDDGSSRLFVISAGNNRNVKPELDYWEQAHLAEIENPAQSWNALTVGAYTEKTTNDDPSFKGWSPFSKHGDISPSSRSSVNWEWRSQAPYKPDIVAEGGNWLISPDKKEVSNEDVVALLTTSGRTTGLLFEKGADTSAACALISRYAAILTSEYPKYRPETIRGLLIHSAQWTPVMWERYGTLNSQHASKTAKEIMLRTVGYGVPDLNRARYSLNHALTLIAESEITPFGKDKKEKGKTLSPDPKLNEMHLYQLPWPVETLRQLPPETELKLKVTLSYFVEPNPSRRGYRQRYSYQSHGLRFEIIRPNQSINNFRSYINGLADSTDYFGPEGDNEGWVFGSQLRTKGSVHSDVWSGSAADLADMNTIAVFPVGGWWKYRTSDDRWKNKVSYSLLVSIESPDENIDIFTEISTRINVDVPIGIGIS